jgi:hypothetical protein
MLMKIAKTVIGYKILQRLMHGSDKSGRRR